MRQRSLLIYTILPHVGGSATIARSLAEFALAEGWRVCVLVRRQAYGYNEGLAARLRERGAEVILVGATGGWRDRFAPFEAVVRARLAGADTMLSIGMGQTAVLLAKHGGFRRSFFYYINHDPTVEAVRRLGPGLPAFTGIVTISPVSGDPVRALVPPPRDVRWIAQFSELPTATAGARPERAAGPVYGFAGALMESKGVSQLLEIWRTHPALGRLEIVGDGALRAAVEAAAAGDARITYHGSFPAQDRERVLPGFFARLDALLVPSRGHGEGIPTVILEALCCGCPVVASDGGGTRAFGESPLAGDFSASVKLLPEEGWKQALPAGLPVFPARAEIQAAYQRWFGDAIIGARWRELLLGPVR